MAHKEGKRKHQSESTEDTSPKKIKIDDDVNPTPSNTSGGGSYKAAENEWEWEVTPTLKLRVSSFKGNPRVDIRHLMNGHYTKKGVSLSLNTFEAIRSWDKYEEAVKAITAKKN